MEVAFEGPESPVPGGPGRLKTARELTLTSDALYCAATSTIA